MTEMGLPQLPMPIDEMTQMELRNFIPRLIREATGRERPLYGKECSKPEWWPSEIPWTNPKTDPRSNSRKGTWTDALRRVVKCCYVHHNLEPMLEGPKKNSEGANTPVNGGGKVNLPLQEINTSSTQQFTIGDKGKVEAKITVPISGPLPAGRYVWKGALPFPLQQTINTATDHAALPIGAATAKKNVDDDDCLMEVFVCPHCEKEYKHYESLNRHKDLCLKAAHSSPLRKPKTRSQTQNQGKMPCISPAKSQFVPPRPSRVSKPFSFVNYKRPEKASFINSLGLVGTSKAEAIRRENSVREVDCEIIDVEEITTPKTPTTPRTPRSLMSQLSRDASPPSRRKSSLGGERTRRQSMEPMSPTVAARRRLSISVVEEPVVEEKVETVTTAPSPVASKLEESDSDSEASRSDPGEEEKGPKKMALMMIDFCSPLGQRLKNHLNVDYKYVPTIKQEPNIVDTTRADSYEAFCHTPEKNDFVQRLRFRTSAYPVTFRKTKRTCPRVCHRFKFRKADRKEFMKTMSTGLNSRSRKLRRDINRKKLKVVVERLTEKDMEEYQRRVRFSMQNLQKMDQKQFMRWLYPQATFPNGSILGDSNELQQLLGLKVPAQQGGQLLRRGMSPGQALSSKMQAEVSKQRMTIYKSVLADNIFTKPVVKKKYIPKPKCKQKRPNPSDVICISSDDEEDEEITFKKPPPHKRPNHGATETSPKIKWKTVLFKCHLCKQEIQYTHDSLDLIIEHFSAVHKVNNLDLVEEKDASGRKVMSIVKAKKTSAKQTSQNKSAAKPSQPAHKQKSPLDDKRLEIICLD